MASAVSIAIPTLAAALVVSLVMRRSARHAAERKRPPSSDGPASFGLPSPFWKIMAGCGVGILAFPVVISIGCLLEGASPFKWDELWFLIPSGLCLLAAWYYRTWRLSCNEEGLHLRRLLLPDRDVRWEDVDSVVFTDEGQKMTVTAGGRKWAWWPTMYIGEGDDPSLLRKACEAHGVPTCPEEELPEGVMGPHGLARHGMSQKKKDAIVLVICIAIPTVLIALLHFFVGDGSPVR